MKIAEFNTTPLGVKVRCDGKTYTLVDKIRDTHEAILKKNDGSGFNRKIRCLEIELYHGKK